MIFDCSYTSRDVEALAGVSQTVQRDWRRREILEWGIERRRGRWAYTLLDVTGIAVMAAISGKLGSLWSAKFLATVSTQAIFYRLTGYTSIPMSDDDGEMKYACLREHVGEQESGVSVVLCDDIEEAFGSDSGFSLFVLDIDRLIRNLRPELVETIKAEFAQIRSGEQEAGAA